MVSAVFRSSWCSFYCTVDVVLGVLVCGGGFVVVCRGGLGVVVGGGGVASFPTSSIWLLALCKYEGRFGPCAVTCTSGKQKVNTRGGGAWLIPLSCQNVPGFVNDECALLSLWPPALSTRKGFKILRWAPPPCVYPLSTGHNHTWPNLPGLPPSYLHTESDQILEVGTDWERG